MYIGSTSTSGLLHLIWEALDNDVDEAVTGFGKHIWMSIDREGWVTVRDEVRRMPFDLMLCQGDYLLATTVFSPYHIQARSSQEECTRRQADSKV